MKVNGKKCSKKSKHKVDSKEEFYFRKKLRGYINSNITHQI